MITREQAEANQGKEVVYLQGTDRAEHGVISSVNQLGAFVLYLGDRQSKHTSFRDLTLVTLSVAAIPSPDSASHYLCPSGPTGATHHLVPSADGWLRCRYCHQLEAVILKAGGLDVRS